MLISEMFRSLQGEGKLIGVPTVFVRSVGCNLDCSWCDTKYSFSGGEEKTVDEIVSFIGGCRDVCLTGGEPLLRDEMKELIRRLLSEGHRVSVETNGSVSIADLPDHPDLLVSMDIKCPSSGMADRMRWENLGLLKPKDQLKFVIEDGADLDFAVDFVRTHDIRSAIIFGPVGGTERLEQLVQRVLDEHLDIRVLPQLHKIIWGDRTGV